VPRSKKKKKRWVSKQTKGAVVWTGILASFMALLVFLHRTEGAKR
jgi:hypothetical protein